MRRGFSIFLILLFGFGPLSAMVDGAEDANLPACCRRNGAHHCAMSVEMMATMSHIVDPRPSFTAPLTCPYYPGPSITLLTPAHAMTAAAASAQTGWMETRATVPGNAVARSFPSDAHSGRGPPAGDLI